MKRDPALRRELLAWYDEQKRDLPWRRARDPYAIWVSEIMLQQTRVETVIPYYARFLAKFPTAQALAESPLDDVLTSWAGLGYYRRARMLHQGARFVRERPEGMPRTRDEWLTVPGVGKYTAGAIASIAFGERAPLVDGNVVRVLTRLYGIAGDPQKSATQRTLWAHAERLVDADRPGDFNQALMELGATVCTPKNPTCLVCPWRADCVARAEGQPERYPASKTAATVPTENVTAYVLHAGARVLLAQREETARYGGMWEPPMLMSETAPSWARGTLTPVGEITHVLTHRRVVARVLSGTIARAPKKLPAPYVRAKLVDASGLEGHALSSLARRVLGQVKLSGTPPASRL